MEAIAFYLPQYHVIPENESLYGKNFTEWDNVKNARPLFAGHRQPRKPHRSLGYYSLLDEAFLQYQHDLAWDNGIKGFCYYYYNFSGRRLLEKPLDIIAKSATIRNDFCLCWDHKNWYNNKSITKEIFLEQHFSPEIAKILFRDLLKYINNERYIRISGKPLIAVFAAERNPLMKQYAEIWREEAHRHGLPGLWLAGVEAFGGNDPYTLGLDGMIEFAPNWIKSAQTTPETVKPRQLDYTSILRFMLSKEVPEWPLLRCVFPGWDNTPRRGENGVVITGTSPELFSTYLELIKEYTQSFLPADLQYIFINAWNEWGETCYVEPDEDNALTYLNIINKILKDGG